MAVRVDNRFHGVVLYLRQRGFGTEDSQEILRWSPPHAVIRSLKGSINQVLGIGISPIS